MFVVGRCNRIWWAWYSAVEYRPLFDALLDYVERQPLTFWYAQNKPVPEGDDWNRDWCAWDFERPEDHLEITRRFGPVIRMDWDGPWPDLYDFDDFYDLFYQYGETEHLEHDTLEEEGRFSREFKHWKSRCSSTSPMWYTMSRPSRSYGKRTGRSGGSPKRCTRPCGSERSSRSGRTTAAPIAESSLTSFENRNSVRRSNTY